MATSIKCDLTFIMINILIFENETYMGDTIPADSMLRRWVKV